MSGFPPPTPVTTPVVEPTVASAGLPLLQVPPPVASLKVVVVGIEPPQTIKVPVIAAGLGFTVAIIVETAQPFPKL